jgi:hypothetical protein
MAKRSWFYAALESHMWRALTRLLLKLPLPLRLPIVLVVGVTIIVVAAAIPALLLIYGLRLR